MISRCQSVCSACGRRGICGGAEGGGDLGVVLGAGVAGGLVWFGFGFGFVGGLF